MTLNNIFSKLRKQNRGNYRQFVFCITFSVFLISSFSAIIFSPLVMSVLPEGGDSRKQVYMIFSVAAVGCVMFCIYAAGLFLRYKSRENGVFLALGAPKQQVCGALFGELLQMTAGCALAGLISGNLFAWLIGRLFRIIAAFQISETGILSVMGLGSALFFALIIMGILSFMAWRFMERSNVIDIMHQQRKSEPIKRTAGSRYLIIGLILLVVGVLGGLVLPSIIARAFEKNPGMVFYAFYILALIGIYRIMVYSIAVHRKGRNPQKYYRNMISYGMMKFQGASIVRNMLIISLLMIAGLFAFFYTPTNFFQGKVQSDANPVDFALVYPSGEMKIERSEIEALAGKYHVSIQQYREAEFAQLLASGVVRENYDARGNLIEEYRKDYCYQGFISEDTFNRVTGMNLHVKPGEYKLIKNPSVEETLWDRFDDLDYVQNLETGVERSLVYGGTAEYQGLVHGRGFDTTARFVLSNSDMKALGAGLSAEGKEKQILFNVEDLDASYEFAKELYRQFGMRASEAMKVYTSYDAYQEHTAILAGEEYGYGKKVTLEPEHSEIEVDWKYAPSFKILQQKNSFFSFAFQYILFLYVALICLAAAGMIAYTRSISMGLHNRQVFDDLLKLGANHRYVKRLISSQLQKIYVLPTVVGMALISIFYFILLWQNDGRISGSEWMALGVDVIICALVVLYQWILYRISKMRVTRMVLGV